MNEIDERPISLRWRLCLFAIMAVVFFAFAFSGQADRGFVASIMVAVIVVTAYLRWDLREQGWYWPFFAFVIVGHTLVLFAVDWSIQVKPTILLAPIAFVHFAMLLGVVFLLEKIFQKPSS
ncbi:hypothetical protein P7B02_03385 [Caulobacter segnis]|uniref:hypothetical protein n=1 Tax=Caulobacter segnis TaxID=88688 RepID=UPI00240F2D91|nr:hypothetical protein [Caulobacter segnis]MDG2520574.1 hypothetical protein [Caulobacter segnis]